jgi:hypothetical protein
MSLRPSLAPAARPSVALLGGLAASLLLVACGGSGASGNASASAEKSREQKFIAFAKCLREHGVDVTTPNGARGKFRIGFKGTGSPQKMEAAQNACKKYAPFDRPNLSPQERVEREEAVRKFAKCMREHGINIHAETKEGGAAIAIQTRAPGRPNPESPGFEAAQKACQAFLPKPPKGLPRGGPGAGPSTSRSGGPGGGAGGGPKVGFQIGG